MASARQGKTFSPRSPRTFLVVLLAALGGSACTAPFGPELWAGGASAQQLARDEYECRRDAEIVYRTAAWERVLGAPGEKLYTTCMESRGYTRR